MEEQERKKSERGEMLNFLTAAAPSFFPCSPFSSASLLVAASDTNGGPRVGFWPLSPQAKRRACNYESFWVNVKF